MVRADILACVVQFSPAEAVAIGRYDVTRRREKKQAGELELELASVFRKGDVGKA